MTAVRAFAGMMFPLERIISITWKIYRKSNLVEIDIDGKGCS